MRNLDTIAAIIADYDIVAIQEADTGSLRSGFVNQARYLAQAAGFLFVTEQTNRRVGAISRHSNVLLSRFSPAEVEEYGLPGIPGRGVLRIGIGKGNRSLNVFSAHLALGRRGRHRQMLFLSRLMADYPNVVVMGDFNCPSESPEMKGLLQRADLHEPRRGLNTFPSWRPNRQLDHILVSRHIDVEKMFVLSHSASDHLPIAMQIRMPGQW